MTSCHSLSYADRSASCAILVMFLCLGSACGSGNSPTQPSASDSITRTFTGTLAAPVYITAGGTIGNSDYVASYPFTAAGVVELTVTSLDPPFPTNAPQNSSPTSGPIWLVIDSVAGGRCVLLPPRTSGNSSAVIFSASSTAQLSQMITQPGSQYCAQIFNFSTGPVTYALQVRATIGIQFLPSSVISGLATVTSSTVTPVPAKAGQTITISLTFGVTNGGTADSIYWISNFAPVGGPPDAVPPGTLTPRSGGPIPSGTTVILTYATTAPVSAVLNVVTSKQPITLTNVVPSDGTVSSIFLNVQ